MLAPCPATQGSTAGGRESPPCAVSPSSMGSGPELRHSTSPPTHCPDGSASDASRGSLGTEGIPGSREVGYKCCDGSQAHAVTGMPLLSPWMTPLLAGSWSQTQHGTEHPVPLRMGTCTAHGFPGHRWDRALPPGSQHHWDTTGTLLGSSPMTRHSLNRQQVVRIRPAPGTVPGTRRTPHIVQSFGWWELGTAQG